MTEPAYSYRDDPAVPDFPDERPVVIFDGMCVLCSGGGRLLAHLDKKGCFRLMAAQSRVGAALFDHYALASDDYQTMILLEEGIVWQRSDAWLRICARLGFPYSVLSLARWLPRRLRDGIYNLVARNRFRWFGRRQTCYLPEPDETDRFIS